MADLPLSLARLVKSLRRLPGVGTRSAERMAQQVMRGDLTWPQELAEGILECRERVRPCPECGFYSDTGGLCEICQDKSRDASLLCVVEGPQDVLTFERAGAFRGYYHCLGGKISPLDGVGPENLTIEKLCERAAAAEVQEVILALGSDVEGETTSLHLIGELEPTGKKVSTLARGIAVGTGLDAADPVTLAHALTARSATRRE